MTQLGFSELLIEADQENKARKFENKTAHLPSTMVEAIPFHSSQIEAHHAAMLTCDFDTAVAIREQAHLLARRLDTERRGILASYDAPGCVLAQECPAAPGDIPLWGQDGAFIIDAAGMRLSIDIRGMFGIGATAMTYCGFSVRAVDPCKPFLSETGYRRFLGASIPPYEDMTTADFALDVIAAFVRNKLKGRLHTIDPKWRE